MGMTMGLERDNEDGNAGHSENDNEDRHRGIGGVVVRASAFHI
jgi:hypothetical protein